MGSKKNKEGPKLHFGLGDLSGWTPTGVSDYRAMSSTPAIRELMQNGLDAARDIGKVPARMRFRIEECPTRNIPGIKSYQEAFEGAQESQREKLKGKISDNAKAIIKDIKECLSESTCKVLHVLDNGVGLDKGRMEALLADGISVKDSNASGSYGIGHVVVFPTSDLRYVLYGGLFTENQTRKMICAGHAILASRKSTTGGALSKDGYFVNKLENDMFNPYVFPEDDDIPSLLRKQLEWVRSEWQRGSVVSIVGFNHFRKDSTSLHEEIFRVGSCNFFEAIYRDNMVVEFEDKEGIKTLDKTTLEQVLEKQKCQKRSSDKFLSGKMAYEAFLTLKKGEKEIVSTELGEMEITITCPAKSGQTRLHLCRNGMWITSRIPMLRVQQFSELKPFHCVISLQEKNKELNELFREAEGPLHNGINLKLLSRDKNKKKRMDGVLLAIREKLKEIVPVLDEESFRPDDILLVKTRGFADGVGKKGNMSGTASKFKRSRVRLNSGDEENQGSDLEVDEKEENKDISPKAKRKESNPFRREGNHMQFQGLVVPQGYRSCKASIISGEKTQESEIRFALDESIDVTSDGITKDTFVVVKPDGLKLNGNLVEEKQLRRNDKGEILGITLGGLEKEQRCDIEFGYVIPEQLDIGDNQHVVLKAEMMRRTPSSKKKVELP